MLDHVQLTLIHGSNSHGSRAVLFFTASDFAFTTGCVYNWVSFLLWPSGFLLSGAIRNCPSLFPSSVLGTFWPWSSSSGVVSFCLFILLMGFSLQQHWSSLPSPPHVEILLSELFTITCPSWVPLHAIAHCFIELLHKPLLNNKAVIHKGYLASYYT